MYAEETEKVVLYLQSVKAKQSTVTISGRDATWVHGITDQIEQIFNNKKLGYAVFLEHRILRLTTYVILLVLALGSAYFVTPIVLKEIPLLLLYFMLGMLVLEWVFEKLYPRFEFGEEPLQKKIRKWIFALIISSGILSTIILKIMGVS